MATARVNGISVGYDDEGDGTPLVLVHGHPFDRSMWTPQVGEFTQSGQRVIVPDLRGYGESRATPGSFAWATLPTTSPHFWIISRWTTLCWVACPWAVRS